MLKKVGIAIALAVSVNNPAHSSGWKFATVEDRDACRQAVYTFQIQKEWYIDNMNEKYGYGRSREKYAYSEALRAKFKQDIRQLQKDCKGDRNMRGVASDLYYEGQTNNSGVDPYPFN